MRKALPLPKFPLRQLPIPTHDSLTDRLLSLPDPFGGTHRCRGNVVWNGGPSMPLGVGGAGNGCSDANPTCNTAQLLSRNAFNAPDSRPSMNLTTYRLIPGGSSANVTAHLWRPLPAFGAWQAAVPPGPAVPPGTLGNVVPLDRAGASRTAGRDAPGAYDLT